MFTPLVICVLVGVIVAKPQPGPEQIRIVGGEDIDITEAPYQVSIVYRGRHSCGGTIVASDLVITAAHCIMGANPSDYQIRAGSSFSDKGGELYPVGDLIWHPGFDYMGMDSDIAVIWLSKPFVFSDRVAPVAMADENDDILDGDETIVTGWGHVKEGGGYPAVLQRVLVPKVNENNCSAAYSALYSITPRMLCAGIPTGGKDACQGDSGGPLLHDNKLAGVVSWGLGCARPQYPGVYARVSALRDWIDENAMILRLRHVLRT